MVVPHELGRSLSCCVPHCCWDRWRVFARHRGVCTYMLRIGRQGMFLETACHQGMSLASCHTAHEQAIGGDNHYGYMCVSRSTCRRLPDSEKLCCPLDRLPFCWCIPVQTLSTLCFGRLQQVLLPGVPLSLGCVLAFVRQELACNGPPHTRRYVFTRVVHIRGVFSLSALLPCQHPSSFPPSFVVGSRARCW